MKHQQGGGGQAIMGPERVEAQGHCPDCSASSLDMGTVDCLERRMSQQDKNNQHM